MTVLYVLPPWLLRAPRMFACFESESSSRVKESTEESLEVSLQTVETMLRALFFSENHYWEIIKTRRKALY